MKTLVEQFMEEQGLPMSPNFKKMDMDGWIRWRQGKEKYPEAEEWAKEV